MRRFNHSQEIDGGRIFLRILKPADATDRYAAWLNDPVVNQYLETRQTTKEELRRYIQDKRKSGAAELFGIFWQKTSRHIGNVKLEPIDFNAGTATMGILIGEKEFWGKGIATEVANLIVAYAFATLGLREVNLGVIAENKAALRVYEKCGFEVYQVDQQVMDHGGKKFDRVWMRKRQAK